jgi:iron complex transport system ATP-binding protein
MPSTTASGGASPPLRVRNLDAGYASRIVAKNISFDLEAGGLLVLLGVNGSGKTTLIKTLAGLLPAISGIVELGGAPIGKLTLKARARRIAYVPQTGVAAWPFSVREVVKTARYSRVGAFGSFGSEDLKAVNEAIAAMDLAALAERAFTTLSGGEARRVLIARALAQDCPAILLDEPCAHLDPGRQIELMEGLVDLAAGGKALLVSLHDVNLARRYAKSIVLVMPDGSAVTGSPDRILVPEILEKAFNTEFLFGHHEEYGRYVLPVATLGDKGDRSCER